MVTLEAKKRNLQDPEKAAMQKISVINQLLCEGNSKLADALKKNDAKVAQIMIDTAAKDSSEHSDELKATKEINVLFAKSNKTYASRIMMVCLENHLVKSGSSYVHKTADWKNISVTDT